MSSSRKTTSAPHGGAGSRRGSDSTHLTLLARLAEAKDAAWQEFCDRYGRLIQNYARAAGLNREDCDEVFQTVNEALFKRMKGFVYDPAKGTFRGYLRAVVNHAVLAVRTRSSEISSFSPYPGGTLDEMCRLDPKLDETWEEEWRHYHMLRALEKVEPEFNATDRKAFELYVRRGRSVEETARQLGMSHDQVYKAKSRIMKRLQETVDRQIQEEG